MVGFEPSNHSVHRVRQCSSYRLGFVISKLSSIATTELMQTLPQCYAATTAARCFQDNWQLRDHGLRNQSRRLAATALDWARQPSACRRCWNWSICILIDIFIQLREVCGAESSQNDLVTYGLQKTIYSLFQLKVNQFKFKKVWSGDHRLSSRGAGLPWLQLSSSSGWTMAPFARGLGAVVHRPKHLEFHGWKLREREFWGLFAAWSVCFFPLRKSLEESESLNRWLIYIYINITYLLQMMYILTI